MCFAVYKPERKYFKMTFVRLGEARRCCKLHQHFYWSSTQDPAKIVTLLCVFVCKPFYFWSWILYHYHYYIQKQSTSYPLHSERSPPLHGYSERSAQIWTSAKSNSPSTDALHRTGERPQMGWTQLQYTHTYRPRNHFEDQNVHIREDRWLDRGVKEDVNVKLEKPSLRRHLSAAYNAALASVPSISQITTTPPTHPLWAWW